jgi:hypothetical protein
LAQVPPEQRQRLIRGDLWPVLAADQHTWQVTGNPVQFPFPVQSATAKLTATGHVSYVDVFDQVERIVDAVAEPFSHNGRVVPVVKQPERGVSDRTDYPDGIGGVCQEMPGMVDPVVERFQEQTNRAALKALCGDRERGHNRLTLDGPRHAWALGPGLNNEETGARRFGRVS